MTSPDLPDLLPQQPVTPLPQQPLPADEPIDVIGEIVGGIRRNREQQFMLSFQRATERDPDLAAEVKRLGIETQIDDETIARNLPRARQLAQIGMARRKLAARTDAVLHRQMSDPEFAALAWDDTENLSAWEQISGNFRAGALEVERGRLGTRMIDGQATQNDLQRLGAIQRELEALPTGNSWIGGPARYAGQFSSTLPRALALGSGTAAVAIAAGQAGPQVALPEEVVTVPTAFAFGFTSGLAIQAFQIEAGNAYIDYRKGGLDEATSRNAARMVGTVNASLELVGFSLLAAPVRKLITSRIKREAVKRLYRLTPAAATLRALKEAGLGLAGEIGTEVLQEGITMTGEEVARSRTESLRQRIEGGATGDIRVPEGGFVRVGEGGQLEVPPETFQRVMGGPLPASNVRMEGDVARQFVEMVDERLPASSAIARGEFFDALLDTAEFTLKGAWLPSIGGPALRLIGDSHRIRTAKSGEQVLEALIKNADEAKLRARSADAYSQFLANTVRGDRGENLYVRREDFLDALTRAGETVDSLQVELPEVYAQLQADPEVQPDVVIPLSEFVGKSLYETNLGQALRPHLRVDPDGLSPTQASKLESEIAESASKLEERLASDEDLQNVWRAEADAIEQRVADEIRATGRVQPDQIAANAQLYRRALENFAARLGLTPAQFEEKHGKLTTVRGETRDLAPGELSQGLSEAELALFPETLDVPEGVTLERVAAQATDEADVQQLFDKLRDIEGDDGVALDRLRDTVLQRLGQDDLDDLESGQWQYIYRTDAQAVIDAWRDSVRGLVYARGGDIEDVRAATVEDLQAEFAQGFGDAARTPVRLREQFAEESTAAQRRRGIGLLRQNDDDSRISDPTPEIRRLDETPLFSRDDPRSQPNGAFDPKTLTAILFQKTNASTWQHEMAHFFFEIMTQIGLGPDTPADVRADLETLAQWGGFESWEDYVTAPAEARRKLHEAFAYSWERYLHSGVAPSADSKLLALFRKFTRWITDAYRGIAGAMNQSYKQEFGEDLPILTGEVRQVMDRLLASQDAIEHARKVRGYDALFEASADPGVLDSLTPEARATLRNLVIDADNEAHEQLQARMLRQLRYVQNLRSKHLREIQKESRDVRKRIRAEVLAELRLATVHRVQRLLDTGEWLSEDGTPIVDPTVGRIRLNVDDLPAKWTSKTGAHPDRVAAMFGYPSAQDLLDDLRTAPDLKTAVEAETDRRMWETHDELLDPILIEDAVVSAISNEATQKLIAAQMRLFDQSLPGVRELTAAAREVARRVIGQRTVGQVSAREYSLAAGRALREARAAQLAGDLPAFRAAQRTALFQTALAREAADVRQEIRDAQKRAQRLTRPPKKLARQGRMVPIVQVARSILAAHNLTTAPPESASPNWSPVRILAESESESDRRLAGELQNTLRDELADAKDYRELTVDEFRDLATLADSLWFRSLREQQIIVDGRRQELAAVAAQIVQQAERLSPAEREVGGALTQRERAGRWFRRQLALYERMEFVFRRLDGSTPGVFTKAIWRRAKDAANQMRLDEARYLERLQGLVDALKLPAGTIVAKGLRVDGKDHVFGRNDGNGKVELVGALLHTGNLSNLYKLAVGWGWGKSRPDGTVDLTRWRQFLQSQIDNGTLTRADFDFAQSVWDLNEELLPQMQRAHYDVAGYEFRTVPARPFSVVFPDGTTQSYRGGYVPAAVDREQVVQAHFWDAEDLLGYQKTMPMVPRGSTKERVERYARELDLNVLRAAEHLHKALLFTHMAPALRDIRRVLDHHDVQAALDKIDPQLRVELIAPWLESLATQRTTLIARDTWAWLNGWRQKAGMVVMFANVKNVVQNLSGLPLALTQVRPRHLSHALGEVMRDRGEVMRQVSEHSAYMRDRWTNSNVYEVRDRLEALVRDPSGFTKAQRWFARHAYWMQRLTQEPIDATVWLGAYNQAIVDQGADTAGDVAHAEAVQRADAAVRQTQTANNPEDLSTIEKGGGLAKLFLQFRGWFIGWGNLVRTEAAIGVREQAGIDRWATIGALYMTGVFVPLVLAEIIDGMLDGDQPDEDDDGSVIDDVAWRTVRAHVQALTGSIPIWGDAGQVAFNMGFDNQSWNTRMPEPPTLSTLRFGLAAVRSGDFGDLRKVRSVLTALSVALGVPLERLLSPVLYGAEVATGQVEPEGPFGPGVETARGLITGRSNRASRQ